MGGAYIVLASAVVQSSINKYVYTNGIKRGSKSL